MEDKFIYKFVVCRELMTLSMLVSSPSLKTVINGIIDRTGTSSAYIRWMIMNTQQSNFSFVNIYLIQKFHKKIIDKYPGTYNQIKIYNNSSEFSNDFQINLSVTNIYNFDDFFDYIESIEFEIYNDEYGNIYEIYRDIYSVNCPRYLNDEYSNTTSVDEEFADQSVDSEDYFHIVPKREPNE